MIVVYSIANHIKKQQNITKSSIKIYVSFIITFFILENKEKKSPDFSSELDFIGSDLSTIQVRDENNTIHTLFWFLFN